MFLVALACLPALLLFAPLSFAEDASRESDLDRIGRLVRESAGIQSHYSVCPASAAKKARPFWRALWQSPDWSIEQCGGKTDACQRDCLTKSNENACFALARVFEEAKPAVSPHIAQMLFAQACALGSRGGCTNRAAGIRNGSYDGDPMLAEQPDALDICYFKTFSISCGDGDAWGCAMLGQSYQFGEGTEKDGAAARRHYTRACEINAEFPACDFARSHLETLDGG